MIKLPLTNVRHVLAVASGKGGVGKTTVTINLTLALQKLGARVGIFDADIYGPNVPLMLGVHRRQQSQGWLPVVRPKDAPAYIKPLTRFGLKVMSVGLVENMSYFICPNCGEEHEIFQHSNRWRPEALEDVPLLGRVPLAPGISQGINQANPLMHNNPDSAQAGVFLDIAAAVGERLAWNEGE